MQRLAVLLALLIAAAPAAAQTTVPGNDGRARLGQFLPPPPPLPLPAANQPPAAGTEAQSPGDRDAQQQRRPWRELTDSLLELMAPRALLAGGMLDDPLTTGFGNPDFVEPLEVKQLQPPVLPPPASLPEG